MATWVYHTTREVLYPTVESTDPAWGNAAKRLFPRGRKDTYFKNRWKDADMRDSYIMLRWTTLGNIPPAAKLVAAVLSPRFDLAPFVRRDTR